MNSPVMKKFILGIAIIVFLGGLGYFAFTNDIFQSSSNSVVARVNGQEVTQKELDTRVERTRASLESQGIIFSDEDLESLRERALSDIITEVLLFQYADQTEITITTEEIEAEYQEVAALFTTPEEFRATLDQQQISEEELREEIRQQLVIQKVAELQAEQSGVIVTEEEIQQAYNEAVAAGNEVPPLEDAREDLEAFLRQQEIDQIMNVFIESLRTSALIEFQS